MIINAKVDSRGITSPALVLRENSTYEYLYLLGVLPFDFCFKTAVRGVKFISVNHIDEILES